MIENFFFSQFEFTLKPLESIKIHKYSQGNILRGAFGYSLRKIVCKEDKYVQCCDCFFKEKCPFYLLFSPERATLVKRMKNTPRGYIFKPPLEDTTIYKPDKPFTFGMVLVGDRIEFLPYIIVPIIEMGNSGIGYNKGKFILEDIKVIINRESDSIYCSEGKVVKNIVPTYKGLELINTANNMQVNSRISLKFLTPTRIKYNPTGKINDSRLVRVPEFHHLIKRLRDRINALSLAYCQAPLNIDFKKIGEQAEKVNIIETNLRWVERKRKNIIKNSFHIQSGFIGKIVYEGDIKQFLPLLYLGQYVHVGEDAVFGSGWYQINGNK